MAGNRLGSIAYYLFPLTKRWFFREKCFQILELFQTVKMNARVSDENRRVGASLLHNVITILRVAELTDITMCCV